MTYHYSSSRQSLDQVHSLRDLEACYESISDVLSMLIQVLLRCLQSR